MTFGITLTAKEQTALDKHIVEIERTREVELRRDERSIITYRYIQSVVLPMRKDTSERRASRKESKQISHDSQLKWASNRPPRHATIR